MLNRKQIVVIGSVVVLMGILLSMDIQGLVKSKEERRISSEAKSPIVSVVTVESISAKAKQNLNANLAQQITELENSLKNASGAEQLALQKQLSQKWDDVNQPAPSAFYYESISVTDNTYINWVKAGDRFTDAYQNTQDSLIQPALVQKAIFAYKKATEIDAKGLDARTGLGVAYVTEATSPMQGITLLLGVVKEDPNNIKANMNLGLFSMKSGQFDKAVNRFKTVIAQKPQADAWFYLASSYENMGLKDDAITAYLKSKEMAADPSLGQFVDRKIEELRK